jgi:Domain of unknown function (DUF4350)
MLFLLILLSFSPVSSQQNPPHYSTDATSYNGIGKFLNTVSKKNIHLVKQKQLNWSLIKPSKTSLLFLSPTTTISPEKLSSFLHMGGVALIADDYREGRKIFETLEIHLEEEETRFPLAISVSSDIFDLLDIVEIRTNHPCSFDTSRAPLLAFAGSGRAFLLKLSIGKGFLYLLSDPSIFINNMIERKDNKKLIEWLLGVLTEDSRNLYLLQSFSSTGWPMNIKPGDSDSDLTPKTIIPAIYKEVKTILSENRLGQRVLSLFFLIPFIYAILYFAGNITLWSHTPPPKYSSINLHRREIERLLALRDIFHKKLALISSCNPSQISNHKQVIASISKGKTRSEIKAFSEILQKLANLPSNESLFPGNWSPLSVKSLSKELESSIRSLDSQ